MQSELSTDYTTPKRSCYEPRRYRPIHISVATIETPPLVQRVDTSSYTWKHGWFRMTAGICLVEGLTKASTQSRIACYLSSWKVTSQFLRTLRNYSQFIGACKAREKAAYVLRRRACGITPIDFASSGSLLTLAQDVEYPLHHKMFSQNFRHISNF